MSKPTTNRQSSWLVTLIKYGLFASLFMPLIVSGKFIFPYIFPKQAFFQIVIEIIFALYLYLIFIDPRYRPRSSWLWRGILIYFGVMVLSAIFGANTYHSFWSNYERMAGVISILHYVGFAFLAANVFKTKEEWYSFFDISIIASSLQALYGLGQALGMFTSSGGARLDGTIGNASFLAGYMLINAFFALWLFLEKRSIGWRSFYGAVILLNLFIMYQTETRGAIVALIFGLFIMFLFFIFARQKDLAQLPFKQPERLKKYAISLFVFLALISGIIWLNRDSAFVKSSPTLNRVTHISATEATAQTRLLAWQMSWRGFLEKPIFGWGPENYYIVFNKFYNPNLYPVESWFDRSHNAYFDILVNTGILGMSAYLFCVILAFWFLWQAWKKEKIKYFEMAIFMVILIAYGIQNIFLFDTQVTLLLIYFILSFIVFLSFKTDEAATQIKPVKPNFLFVALLIFMTFFSCYSFNLKPASASLTGISALTYLQTGKIAEAVTRFKDAYAIGTFGLPEIAGRAQDAATMIIRQSGISNEMKPENKEMIIVAIDGLRQSLEKEPQNARFMMMLGTLYLISVQQDPSYLSQADLILQEALKLSPTRQELYFTLGQVRLYQGRNDEVLPLFQKAIDLNDKVPISHWNYGIMAVSVGQKEAGEREIKKAVEMGHSYGAEDIQQLINIYTRLKDYPKVVFLYEEWIALPTPTGAQPYAGLAALYAQMGEKQKAKDAALEAAAIDPNYKAEAEQFIKGLGL